MNPFCTKSLPRRTRTLKLTTAKATTKALVMVVTSFGLSAAMPEATAQRLAAATTATATPTIDLEGRSVGAPRLALTEGKSKLISMSASNIRMAVGDPRIADIILLSPGELYLLGKSVGTTNLILWNKDNRATVIDITVGIDTTALQASFALLLPDEKDIRVTSAAGTLILSGVVSDSIKADQALALAHAHVQRGGTGAQGAGASAGAGAGGGGAPMAAAAAAPKVINMLSIAAPQQVMLEVKVAEISKTLVDQLGASFGATRTNGDWTYSLLTNFLKGGAGTLGAIKLPGNGKFINIEAEKRDGLIKILAEPTIMAISGQEASFLAGGKIFIPVSQTNSGGLPTVTLQEQEFGVAVKFTPTVLEGGRINLQVAPEVSELNRDGIGISANGVSGSAILPSFTTRRASTTVQLFDGQSFAIGGLIKNNVTTSVSAFPLLGQIPILGALFRSSDFQTDRSELVFIITPRLVKPLPPDYKLPTDGYVQPSRAEFFLQGQMEGTPSNDTLQHDQNPPRSAP
jgi:pilus assembly protein CpaC